MANNVTDLGKVGITLKGEWSSATNYERLDAVTYEGSLYIAIKDNANVNPGANPTYWLLSAKHGEFTQQQLDDFKAEVVAESKEEMDDYTDDKKAELDTYEGTKETELNTYTGTKKTELDTYAGGLKDDFDSNASTKTTAFNDNATSKTTAFNTNATNKTTDFNDNATAKTTEFNTNASDKTDDFDDNVTAKTTAFDEHVEEKTEEFDENVESLQQEIDELAENMPWTETEQATEIQVTDAAKYSRNKLQLFGNTEQASYAGKNLLPSDASTQTLNDVVITKNNDGSYTLNGTASALTSVKIGDIQIENGKTYTMSSGNSDDSSNSYRIDGRKTVGSIYNNWTTASIPILTATEDVTIGIYIRIANGYNCNNVKIYPQVEEGSTATDYEPYVGGVQSPNPDYPQDIHVVTGNNTVEVQGKNLLEGFELGEINSNTGAETQVQSAIRTKNYIPYDSALTYYRSVNGQAPEGITFNLRFYNQNKEYIGYGAWSSPSGSNFTVHKETSVVDDIPKFIKFRLPTGKIDINNDKAMISTSSDLTFVPYYLEEYPVNLGDIELCKIGNYQDYLYKENGNWYKYEEFQKHEFTTGHSFPTATSNNYYWRFTPTPRHSKGYMKGYIYDSRGSGFNDMSDYHFGFENSGVFHIKNLSANSKEAMRDILVNANEVLYYAKATQTTTQITDTTLIAQLDAIYEHLQLVKGTNNITVTAEDLAPNMKLSYMQDLPSKLNNLASRIELLEE